MIKELIEFATELDQKGLHLQANRIDEAVAKIASSYYDYDQSDEIPMSSNAEYNEDMDKLAKLAKILIRGGTPITGTSEEGEKDEDAAIVELADKMHEMNLGKAAGDILRLLSEVGSPESHRDSKPLELDEDLPF